MPPSPNPTSRPRYAPLRMQWLLLVGGLLLIGLIGASALYTARERLLATEYGRLGKTAEIAELNVGSRAQHTDAVLRALLQLIPPHQPEIWGAPEITARMQKAMPLTGNIAGLALADAQGRIVNSTLPEWRGRTLPITAIFAAPVASAETDRPFRFVHGVDTIGSGVVFGRAIFNARGRLVGALVVRLTLTPLRTLLDSLRYAPDMRVALVAANGVVLAMAPAIEGIEGSNADQPGSFLRAHIQSGAPVTTYLGVPQIVGGKDERQGVIRTSPVPNSDQRLIISTSRSPAAVLAPWRADVRAALLAYGVLILTACSLQYGFYRRQKAAADALEIAYARLEQLAHADALTGLANRRVLQDRLQQALGSARRHQRTLALALIDLDGFKPINDRHGHEAGDAVLVCVARRLEAAVRTEDTVARLGGDEFVLLLPDIGERAACEQLLARVLATLAEPIVLEHATVAVAGSIGVSLFPDDTGADSDAEALLRQADQAMYVAKQAGKNCVRFFAEPPPAQVPAPAPALSGAPAP